MKAAATSVAVVLFGPRGHGGFNQAGLAGAERAQALGATIDVHWCEPPADRADFLRELARRGYGLIVAHGGQGDAPVAAVAHEFPAQSFAITQGHFLAPNVACYEVLQEHSAFLAGVLAAATTRTGVVAHMSGERVLPGLKGRAAFADGVHQQDPAVRLLTLFCGNQHDEALAYRVVSAQAEAGADLLFAMIDGGRPGAIRACREHGVQQIGNVLDWTEREPDVFIASALADSGYCIELAVQDWLAERLCCGAVRAIGLEAPAQVGLAVAPRASAAALARVEHFRLALLSGSLKPRASYDGPEMSLPAA